MAHCLFSLFDPLIRFNKDKMVPWRSGTNLHNIKGTGLQGSKINTIVQIQTSLFIRNLTERISTVDKTSTTDVM